MKLVLFLLSFYAPLASANTETFLAWPLQYHCAVQSLNTSGDLVYGVLAYQRLPYTSQANPEVAEFQAMSNTASPHPFCAKISEAIRDQKAMELTVEQYTEGTILLSIGSSIR